MLKASEKFISVIIRRPQAYDFKNKDRSAPIPGFVFLDTQGNVLGTVQPESAKRLVGKMNELVR